MKTQPAVIERGNRFFQEDALAEFLEDDALAWQPVRPEITHGVSGKVLLAGPTRAVLTRVEPGGRFAPHCDPYAHLFYVLAGLGEVLAGEERRVVGAGSVVRIEAGERHGYENNGETDLLLISLNLPQ
jgi:quercetin dioxygenase-like cupin family protein